MKKYIIWTNRVSSRYELMVKSAFKRYAKEIENACATFADNEPTLDALKRVFDSELAAMKREGANYPRDLYKSEIVDYSTLIVWHIKISTGERDRKVATANIGRY